ncbi:MAG: hypothetical protein AAGG65_19240 [Pseudomonadota bacterium]
MTLNHTTALTLGAMALLVAMAPPVASQEVEILFNGQEIVPESAVDLYAHPPRGFFGSTGGQTSTIEPGTPLAIVGGEEIPLLFGADQTWIQVVPATEVDATSGISQMDGPSAGGWMQIDPDLATELR